MVVEFTNIMHMYTVTKGQTIPVIESEPYESRYKRIQEIILSWDRPPFTTQRLCELLLQPTRQYRQGTKFLMAVTKSVYGVSTRADSEMLIKTEDDEDDMLYFDEDGVAVQIVDYFDDALFNGTNSSQGSTTGMINVSGSLPPGKRKLLCKHILVHYEWRGLVCFLFVCWYYPCSLPCIYDPINLHFIHLSLLMHIPLLLCPTLGTPRPVPKDSIELLLGHK